MYTKFGVPCFVFLTAHLSKENFGKKKHIIPVKAFDWQDIQGYRKIQNIRKMMPPLIRLQNIGDSADFASATSFNLNKDWIFSYLSF